MSEKVDTISRFLKSFWWTWWILIFTLPMYGLFWLISETKSVVENVLLITNTDMKTPASNKIPLIGIGRLKWIVYHPTISIELLKISTLCYCQTINGMLHHFLARLSNLADFSIKSWSACFKIDVPITTKTNTASSQQPSIISL